MRVPPRRLLLAAEALVALAGARLAVVGDRAAWQRRLAVADPATPPPGGVGSERAAEVGRVVAAVARRLPWRADCLPQAIAAQRMLRRRRLPTRLVVGARAGGAPGEDVTMALHAWLVHGDRVVIGRQGHRTFTAVVAYDQVA